MPLNTDEDEEDNWEDEEEEQPKNEKVVKRDVVVKQPTKVVGVKKQEQAVAEFELAQVPTQHTLAIRNKDSGELMSVEEGIVAILNLLSRIEKVVG